MARSCVNQHPKGATKRCAGQPGEMVLMNHTYHAPTHSLIGASGFERWVFKKTLAESLSPKKIIICFV